MSSQGLEDEAMAHIKVGEELKARAALLAASHAKDADDLEFLLSALGIKEAAYEARQSA